MPGAVEIFVNRTSQLCWMQIPVEELSLGLILKFIIKMQMNFNPIAHDTAFQILYRDRQHRLVPVTDKFPFDTDQPWSRLCLAQFSLKPIIAPISGRSATRSFGWTFRESSNGLTLAWTKIWIYN